MTDVKPTKVFCPICDRRTYVKANGDCPVCSSFLTMYPREHLAPKGDV